MMIKQIWVAQCDVCGKIENAKITMDGYNEEGHTLPEGWGYGRTKDIHLCPECSKRMVKKEGEDEVLLQAAKGIKEICDNADGCDKCPFSYLNGRICVMCKFSDRWGYRSEPSEWNLDGNS